MRIIKSIVLFLVGFCTYITVEVCYRGYSFPLMGLCAALAFLIMDKLNDKISWDMDILLQGFMGSVLITSFEFIIGEIALHGYLPIMWNYSNVIMNYKGIICLPFSLVWTGLSIITILICDMINYYVFREADVPYYKLFGKTILRFKPIK